MVILIADNPHEARKLRRLKKIRGVDFAGLACEYIYP